jgi:hypothetical protein
MANPPVYDDERHDTYIEYSDSGTTVGIAPISSGATALALAGRLQHLGNAACNRSDWMPDRATCTTVEARFADILRALTSSDTVSARAALRAAAAVLDQAYCGRPGDTGPSSTTGLDPQPCDLRPFNTSTTYRPVAAEGYALLRPNVTYLLRRL